MTKEEIIKLINEKQDILKRAEIIFHQMQGQLNILEEIKKKDFPEEPLK